MQDMITRAWVSVETKAYMLKNRARNFKDDERGVGAMVATIIIMLIVVLLAAVFWDSIKQWFEDMMETIFKTGSAGNFNKPEDKYNPQ